MMIHSDRVFSSKELDSEDDLVEAMTKHKWPLCYSFYHDSLLYLNDSDSEDDPEYVVMKFDKAEGHHDVIGREVGKIKPKGMDTAQVHKFIQEMGLASGAWRIRCTSGLSRYGIIAASCAGWKRSEARAFAFLLLQTIAG